ncbi:amidase signature enzyme [Obba rivulosa]|uniref:amidase n=1 Tax=Obba rivulosa TaxID=1052685 RepID=A0A8E2J5E5_9APHY|nr:amidase signature enzyme [Obba rivulosa]
MPWPFSSSSWKDVALHKRAHRDEAVAVARAADNGSPSSSEPLENQAYLRATAPEIVKQIGSGEWTASQVLEAYIERAVLAQNITNCLTEVMFEAARQTAQELDAEFAATKKLRGPLHGVPISFKDIYDIKGYDTTMGFTTYADQPASEDAHLVRLVREAGGVILAKTNIPQTMMFFECNNPVWGRTLNPHSVGYTCGGSSGGDAALLAMDGCALGLGSDIGGSLRIPASFCGVYGFKPGWMRAGDGGVRNCWAGFEALHGTVGPMGRSVDDLELACRLMFGVRDKVAFNPAPIPFREVKLPQKLRFGYYLSDGLIKPSPACQRAVRETIEALRREGHECVEIKVPDPAKGMELFAALTSADGYKTLTEPIGADPTEAGLYFILLGPKLFDWMRAMLRRAAQIVYNDDMFGRVMSAARKKSVYEYWKWTDDRDQYCKLFYREVWNKHELDGIIAPVQAIPALPNDTCKFLSLLAGPTILYNAVDSPVGTVPVIRVDPALDTHTTEWSDRKASDGHGSRVYERMLYEQGMTSKFKNGYYDAKKMEGIPVGVQVVGRQWEDEKVLAMMRVVDDALGERGFGPLSWKGQRKDP